MGIKALKGLTIKIGGDTSDLTKSLDKVEKQGAGLSKELGQINKLLKLDPKNTDLLAQKQKVLADAISNTEKKLETLREAEAQAQEKFAQGKISEAQYRALQREIIATEKQLEKYQGAAKETADAVEALGNESGEAAEKIEKQGKETKKTEKATDDLDDSSESLASGGLAAVATAAASAVTAIVALAESSREYRTEMGKLDAAFTDNEHSAEAATKTYEALQSVVGETEQAVEAANHLAALCDNEKELADWTEILTGVYGRWGSSIPIENIAEAANETAKSGKLTGGLVDSLVWAGIQEEKFQEQLDACSNEQERQQLITKTLTKLYGSAAAQYKKTNAEVIRANQATEKWNKATAKIGKTVEPVVTDIKELGVTLLEDAGEPLEDIAEYIRRTVIPAIEKTSKWVKKNGPLIKSTAVGVTTALVAFKAASIATTIAQTGLKGAIVATTVAQKALALAQAATPWGLAAVAIAGVTAALIAFSSAANKAKEPVDVLTREERELMKAADEAAEAFWDQKKATDSTLGGITAQMGYVSDLTEELQSLANTTGFVQETDKERVQFILNELNEALGTEYTMVGNVIKGYETLKRTINEVIQAKLANSLVEAAHDDYVAAVQNEADALENLNLKHEDYQAQVQRTKEADEAWFNADAEYQEAKRSGQSIWIENAAIAAEEAESAYHKEVGILDEKKTAYDEAAATYSGYYNAIANYEEAQAAVLSGNYQKAVDILAKKGGAYGTYSDKVDEETAKVLDTLYKEAVDAGLEAERTKKNFENGVDGYTKEMVTEAEKGYQETLNEFATAYADAEGVGEDLADGMTDGAENKRAGLLSKARSLVSGFLEAAREAADSHSPSRKAIAIFEDIGEGAEIGVENKTPDVARAGREQASALLDEYRTQEVHAQQALRNIADQEAARTTAGQLTAATANSGMLGEILQAIRDGQVLLLDSETLVGGTANRMDSRLGQLRVLTERGAR